MFTLGNHLSDEEKYPNLSIAYLHYKKHVADGNWGVLRQDTPPTNKQIALMQQFLRSAYCRTILTPHEFYPLCEFIGSTANDWVSRDLETRRWVGWFMIGFGKCFCEVFNNF